MASVTFDNVSKCYGSDKTAVKDLNLQVNDGELLVLVGPSGCGKSTTLRMVAGLEDISRGRILIGARCVNNVLPKDRDIAMVFQNYALYPNKTVFDNMAFCLQIRKTPRDEIRRAVLDAAHTLGLDDYLDRYPRQLSGGQRQRVALGRCIVRKPAVFLFDEPLSNLDAKMRVQMRLEICRLHQSLGATMLYVTHDQVEAMTMGDRIAVMQDGVVQQVAAPQELYNAPANRFVAGFIGTPPMNFIETTRNGRHVVLGLRPEHILLDNASPIRAIVETVEPTGPETYLHLRYQNQEITVRVPPQDALPPGTTVGIALPEDKAHVFDD